MSLFKRYVLLLMLLWLPAKGVLSAGMLPGPDGPPEAVAISGHHCHGADAQSTPAVPEAAPCCDEGAGSLTCHGLCAVFLMAEFVAPATLAGTMPPSARSEYYRSYIPQQPERPPLV